MAITDVCEIQPSTTAFNPETGESWGEDFQARHFFFRSTATRDAGVLVGLTQASVTQDVTVMPIPADQILPSTYCFD